MNIRSSLGLRAKVALPFAISAIALIVIGLFSVLTARNLVAHTEALSERYLPAVSEALNGDRDLYQALVAQMSFISATENNEPPDQHKADFEENAGQALERLNKAIERLRGTGISEKIEGFRATYDEWLNTARQSMKIARSGDPHAGHQMLIGPSNQAFSQLRGYYDRVGIHADEQAQFVAHEASGEGLSSSVFILIITVGAVIIGILLFVVFLRMIVQSVGVLRKQLDNIAQGEGDLTQRIPVETDDDLGKLAVSFNHVLENLQTMIGSIQNLSKQLGEGASELSTAASDNSNGVTRQTDAISMVATAINEMQSAIEEVAGNASRAADITKQAQEKGRNGATIIRNSSVQVQRLAAQISKAVEVIRKLSQDSENITSVLDVIREIADQTNLLALNAAIEAARAGEQGRGFAVVADEVRTLAKRTQQSTEDIQTMITALQTGVADIVAVMETGSKEAVETEKLATEAEAELQGILESMADISDMNTSVASATEEQTQVVDEINRSVTEINDLAAEGMKRSGSIDRISKSLDDYARELEQQTGRFRV
ncbi:methyl-accepting chemotaxis protein [Marinobacter sp. 71-i]|uniref:Methyl-accepting chemotaxis protein n=1 Tax=Marinobacter iranensis TaxID=2962607 RepID=A0ABT5Y5G9_9GAMM|nr:methyl-accepting chemotaxis protein [Marinobacter iranensis]MDF0748826.1 methyl-accepting chemotaxis protein [Marinobacter iranensis]